MYLRINGTTSEVSGMCVEASRLKTVSESKMVTPTTILSPLSGGRVNKINVIIDVTIHGAMR